jgi:D-alanyl-D-alanine carboxypeptidase (penicillin-binding protein 5/6)
MRPTQRPQRHYGPYLAVFLCVILIAVYVAFALHRPLPVLKVHVTVPPVGATADTKASLPWPGYGESALGVEGYGVLDTHGEQNALPTASVAKVMTALAILRQKPLKPGEQGPMLTLTARDVGYYQKYVAQDGSVVPVNNGEQITEYQALQALMLPSANNIAESLVVWAFGSVDAYNAYAQQVGTQLGLTNTHITDASGFSSKTTASARDVVKIGLAAMKNPVLAEIAGQKTAVIPVAGQIDNLNFLLGQDNIVGIKTGNTEEAGGCFLVASKVTVNGAPTYLVAAVMGAPTLGAAIRDSRPLIAAVPSLFHQTSIAGARQIVGSVQARWGTVSSVTTKTALSAATWQGFTPSLRATTTAPRAPAPAGTVVGQLKLSLNDQASTTNLVTATAINPPSNWWRLTHPF